MAAFWRELHRTWLLFGVSSQMESTSSSVVLKWNPKVQVSFSNGAPKFKCRSQTQPQNPSVVLECNSKVQVSFSKSEEEHSSPGPKSILFLGPRAFCSWAHEHFAPEPRSIMFLVPRAFSRTPCVCDDSRGPRGRSLAPTLGTPTT